MKRLFSRPKPSAASFALFALLWAIVGLIALFLIVYLGDESDIPSTLNDMLYFWPEILTVCIIVGSVIGSIHYVLARAFCRGDNQSFKPREISAVVLATSLFCAYPVYHLIDLKRTMRIENACAQWEVEAEIKSHVNKGDVRQAVRVMENSCEKYHQIDRENISNKSAWLIHRRAPSGDGYYYCTLSPGWYTLSMNLPGGVHNYLNMEIGGGGASAPEKWQPLGHEMTASKTPIIRILGYWLIEDRALFCEEVYQQYDSGDQTYRALKDVVCFEYDPDLKRALQRIVSFQPMQMTEKIAPGTYLFYEEKDSDSRAYKLAIQILESGQTLDDPDAIRPMIERYLKSGRLSSPARQATRAQAHEQLMRQLGFSP